MTLTAKEKRQENGLFEAIFARRSVRAYEPAEFGRNAVQTWLMETNSVITI